MKNTKTEHKYNYEGKTYFFESEKNLDLFRDNPEKYLGKGGIMLARMLFQSWRFSIKRKLLAVITIFLAAGLISALLAVSIDIGDKMAKSSNLTEPIF